jgi:DNA-binding phage protein
VNKSTIDALTEATLMPHTSGMDYDKLPERLARVENLKDFATKAKMHRRTLQRIINREGSPNIATLDAIAQKLKEIKPRMKKAAAQPPSDTVAAA